MAKIRHRTFEIFDFLQEATTALTSKAASATTDACDAKSWTFRQLAAEGRPSGAIHVTFKHPDASQAEFTKDFGADLTQLANEILNGSRVLLDFEGVQEFGNDSIARLTEFNGNIKYKGSRVVLCNLEPTVREAFFPAQKKL